MEDTAPKKAVRPQNKHLIPFKKGQSGNPGGRPPLPTGLKQIKELTAEELNRNLAKFARMAAETVASMAKDPKTPAMEAVICSAFTQAIEFGDPGRLAPFLDRAIPKPKELPDINLNLASMTDAELIERAKEAIQILSTSPGPLVLEGELIRKDPGDAL